MRLRRHLLARHPAAGPSYGRRLVATLAGLLATVAPITPATALASQAASPATPVPPVVLALTDGSADPAAACPETDTTEHKPGEPAKFRSKKTTPPALARTAQPAAIEARHDVIAGARIDASAGAPPASAYRCSPEERGPPRRVCGEASPLICPGAPT